MHKTHVGIDKVQVVDKVQAENESEDKILVSPYFTLKLPQ